ncbi:hypothetical protein QJQ45_029034 [Haematococcus lacustris]|nr:hypothetical protein QJQ45_029034 [Haematococcus lacustris]
MAGGAATQRCSNAAKGMQEVQLESAAAKRGGAEDASSQDFRSNSHDVSPLPSSLTNTQQQPADISDERQPFTSSTLTMTGWSRLQNETAYPTFPSHTQEPAKGLRGAAKTRGKEAQH